MLQSHKITEFSNIYVIFMTDFTNNIGDTIKHYQKSELYQYNKNLTENKSNGCRSH